MADTPAEPGDRLSGRRLLAAFAVLGVALVALSVWAGLLVDKTYAAENRRNDVETVRAVAGRVVTDFYSISYKTIDQDVQRVFAGLSDDFKQQAGRQLDASWKQTVTSNRLVSSAQVTASGVISIDARSAEVMVVIRRTAQSAQATTPVTSTIRTQVRLTKVKGRWRVSGMGALQ